MLVLLFRRGLLLPCVLAKAASYLAGSRCDVRRKKQCGNMAASDGRGARAQLWRGCLPDSIPLDDIRRSALKDGSPAKTLSCAVDIGPERQRI